MTLEAAVAIARTDSDQFGLPMAVYRLKAWPVGVYGVRNPGKLPAEAEIVSTAQPASVAVPEPVAVEADLQGSLF